MALVEALSQSDLPWATLGAGSNLLVPDPGIGAWYSSSTRISTTYKSRRSRGPGGVRLVAGAGLSLSRLAVHAADLGLSGLEFACGIPGSVAGGVRMNAGAHSGCMAEVCGWTARRES